VLVHVTRSAPPATKAPRPWLVGGFLGGIGGSAPLPGGAGWIEHGVPQTPNT
jgi:hypothetical protein